MHISGRSDNGGYKAESHVATMNHNVTEQKNHVVEAKSNFCQHIP